MKIRTLFLALVLPFSAVAEPVKNALFLISDDLNCDLGCYGAKVATPNIDRLAAAGTKFTRAYCQYPLCSPSRTSLLTGRKPDVTGVTTNPGHTMRPHFREALPQTVTLPQLFKNNGIFAARVGKLYHYGVPNDIGTSSLDDYHSWDQVINPRGRDRDIHDRIFSLTPGQFGGTVSWLAADGTDEEHTDGIGATEAIRLLERFKKEGRRFFLAVGFYRPHTPYVAPEKWFKGYPTDAIELPALSAADKAREPKQAYASAKKDQETMTDQQRREAIQAYHASISFMDAQVGRVLDAMDRLGLTSETVISFTSDHGYHLGDHGLWQKMSVFERSARVPLIIAAPGQPRGQTADGPVQLLDLYPTLAHLAGLKTPAYLDGQDLAPTLADAKQSVQTAAFTQVRNGYSVRTAKWRYTEWGPGNASTLHDLESDPAETKNLAPDPAHAATVTELRALLDTYRPK